MGSDITSTIQHRILIIDDSGVNSLIAWRLFRFGYFVALFTAIKQEISWDSQQYGSDTYLPQILTNTFEDLAVKSQDLKIENFDFILLSATTKEALKLLATQIKPFVHPETLILVNSNNFIQSELIVNNILPTSNVLSLISTNDDIKKINTVEFLTKTKSFLSIGLSWDADLPALKHLTKQISPSTLSLLKENNSSCLSILSTSLEQSGFLIGPRLGTHVVLWKNILRLVSYECFAILFNDFDPNHLFYNSLFSPPIKHSMEEIICLAKRYGAILFQTEPGPRRNFLLNLINEFNSNCLKQNGVLNLRPFLFKYLFDHSVVSTLQELLADLLLKATMVGLKMPNIEFLCASLKTRNNTTNQIQNTSFQRATKTVVVKEKPNDLILPPSVAETVNNSADLNSASAGTLESDIQVMWMDSVSYLNNDDKVGIEIESEESVSDTKPVEAETDLPSNKEIETKQAIDVPQHYFINKGVTIPGVDDMNDEANFFPGNISLMDPESVSISNNVIFRDQRSARMNESLELINGPFFNEELPKSRNFGGRFSTTARKFVSFKEVQQSSMSQNPQQRKEFVHRKFKPGYDSKSKHSEKESSYVLINKQHELVKELKSSEYFDDLGVGPYGSLDTMSASIDRLNKTNE